MTWWHDTIRAEHDRQVIQIDTEVEIDVWAYKSNHDHSSADPDSVDRILSERLP